MSSRSWSAGVAAVDEEETSEGDRSSLVKEELGTLAIGDQMEGLDA